MRGSRLLVGAAGSAASDRDINLAHCNRKRHALFRSDREAFVNRVLDVCFRFFQCSSLADTARNGWTLGNEHAVLVLGDGDQELHGISIPSVQGRMPATFNRIRYNPLRAVTYNVFPSESPKVRLDGC